MSKENVLRCQDPNRLMDELGAKIDTRKNATAMSMLYGMKVFQDDSIPDGEVHLVDGEGNVLQKYNLK